MSVLPSAKVNYMILRDKERKKDPKEKKKKVKLFLCSR